MYSLFLAITLSPKIAIEKLELFFPVCTKSSHAHPAIISRKVYYAIGAEYWGHNKQRTSGSVLLFDFNLFGSRDRWGFGFSIPIRVF